MLLKPYQQHVLDELARFTELLVPGRTVAESFRRFWAEHPRLRLAPQPGRPVAPYQARPGLAATVPSLTVKVPTGGGKTLLASHAVGLLGQVGGGGSGQRGLLAVWLVPSLPILQQTLRTLRTPGHPYRRALEVGATGRPVEVLSVDDLHAGHPALRAAAAGEALVVVVLSFASLKFDLGKWLAGDEKKAGSSENRRSFRQNGGHFGFVQAYGAAPDPLPGIDATASIQVLRRLEPVVIVDESHNATTGLSDEMLGHLNPRFVLELTATPTAKANLLAFVGAQELKAEHMVKLPLLVQNLHDATDVLNAAVRLRDRLEALAQEATRRAGAPVVRPIVLVQAQPRTKKAQDSRDTYERVRRKLEAMRIPAEQIKIKVSGLDELGDTDLLAPGCPVRYIITVNALKEGWDCPFAYVLASLAARQSPVEVEQLVGRVLRQPRATPHPVAWLNRSYVLTASARFAETLNQIVKGLHEAGFSEADYRAASVEAPAAPVAPAPELPLPAAAAAANDDDDPAAALDEARLVAATPAQAPAAAFDPTVPLADLPLLPEGAPLGVAAPGAAPAPADPLAALAGQLNARATAPPPAAPATRPTPPTVADQVKDNSYPMRPAVRAQALALRLPQFVVPATEAAGGLWAGTLAAEPAPAPLLTPDQLHGGFLLSEQSTAGLHFEQLPADLYQIDLEEQAEQGYTPRPRQVDARLREEMLRLFDQAPPARQRKEVLAVLGRALATRFDNISAKQLQGYLARIVGDGTDPAVGFDAARLRDARERPEAYAQVIRREIERLLAAHALRAFEQQRRLGRITVAPRYGLPERRALARPALPLDRTLYEREEDGNQFEKKLMLRLAAADNLVFWTRNPSRTVGSFRLNGPVANHYPDFIALTTRGRLLLIETKGDHLNNPKSAANVRLGQAWEQLAGPAQHAYLMVYENAAVEGAVPFAEFVSLLGQF